MPSKAVSDLLLNNLQFCEGQISPEGKGVPLGVHGGGGGGKTFYPCKGQISPQELRHNTQ